MKNKFNKKELLGLVLVILLILGYWYLSGSQDEVIIQEPLVTDDADLVEYQNNQGQTWRLSQAEITEFNVASANDEYPKFVSGKIEPLDVHPGDVQKFEILIEDNVPLTRVWAEIEQDHGTTTVDLVLQESKALTLEDIESRPFIVEESGKLLLNDGSQSRVVFNLFKKAEAQSLVIYTYTGDWTVFDTHSREYHTTFWATDEEGRSNSMTMAWSDPCTPPLNGNWSLDSNCSITSIKGVDNGNYTNVTWTLTVGASGTFVWNSGKSITITSGAISIINGGQLIQSNLWITDSDGDNYAPSGYTRTYNSSEPGGYSRQYTISLTDCYDNNANAKPGQTAWFTVHRGDGSFDYNCSGGTIEYRYGTIVTNECWNHATGNWSGRIGDTDYTKDCTCNGCGIKLISYGTWEYHCGDGNQNGSACDEGFTGIATPANGPASRH